ncbi:MAG: DUF2804 domain-containing protein [Myxococcaceae bacterium]
MLRELTEPVELCLPNGELNPAAVGFSRRPLHRTGLRGWGRNKRWEYWGVITPEHVVGLTLADLDYAGMLQLWLLDRASGREREVTRVTPLGRGVALPDGGPPVQVSARAGGVKIELADGPDGTRIVWSGGGIELELFARAGGDCLGVVVPWSARRFQYTVKDVARPVSGSITVDGRRFESDGWGVLDRGRGRWPYEITWNWGAGSGFVAGRRVGLQLGGKWTRGTGSTECAVFVDGRLSYLPDEPEWTYDVASKSALWRVVAPRIDVTLTPFHMRCTKVNAVVLSTAIHQAFGTWNGWVVDDLGERISVDGLVGWAEEAHNRW